MASHPGLWLVVAVEEDKAQRFQNAIERDDKFTATVSASDVRPKSAELCIVSLSAATAHYLGISRGGQLIATDQKRISVTDLIDLGAIGIDEIKQHLPRRFASRFNITDHTERVTPKLWVAILEAIALLRPRAAKRLPSLRKLIVEILSLRGRREGGLEVFERDAVASALQVFGGGSFRKKILRQASPPEGNEPAPFLARLKGVSVREDPQVIHDSATFPGMEVAKRHQLGAVQLHNERGEQLTILHCNRQPLEQTLGVDLIYYNHTYDSFVLVQYKRMIEESGSGPVYRPAGDANYESEMTRMTQIGTLLDQCAVDEHDLPSAFRLSPQPFFLKFCEAKVKAALDEGMVSGMYVPLALWNAFMDSSDARGKRGGLRISWQHCPRNFNNSSFTALLRKGWIGSAAGQSKVLSKIIEQVLAGRHMLIMAATSPQRSRPDFLRDDFGRFASDDDPLATR